jgi:hypothetical protein
LWYSGLLKGSVRRIDSDDVRQIRAALGKNAAYAILARTCLMTNSDYVLPQLWREVQQRYETIIGEAPAVSEQQEVRLTMILHLGGMLS